MKKLIALLCMLSLVFGLAACGGEKTDTAADPSATQPGETLSGDAQSAEGATDINGKSIPSNIPTGPVTDMPEYFDQTDYVLYMNVFSRKDQNDPSKGMGGDDYVGQKWDKMGIFTVLRDEWNKKDRYYVWGYADQTRCCDFQWEFVPTDVSALPAPGSEIEVKGTLSKSDEALDGFWITEPEITVKKDYKAPDVDFDLTRDSSTLARVQIQNMQQWTDAFKGKTVRIFCRVMGKNTVQHPYYDGAWTMDFQGVEMSAAIGSYIIINGTFTAGEEGGSYLAATDYQEVVI